MKDPELQYYQMGEGVTAFSSTRMGGYSEGSYGEFNINPFCGDSGEAVSKIREILCRTLGIGDSCLLLP
ncbi:MAG: laccase domain-containing protein, partial [Bacteroidales bacterium]|nr:laccase domain-containing protein [Bacteroidales bacterium]